MIVFFSIEVRFLQIAVCWSGFGDFLKRSGSGLLHCLPGIPDCLVVVVGRYLATYSGNYKTR